METVYVIWWRYSDNSGAGVVRAYADRQRAEEDMEAFTHGENGRVYEIVDLPIYHEGKPR